MVNAPTQSGALNRHVRVTGLASDQGDVAKLDVCV